MQVENATFTPTIFTVFGGMSRECKSFVNRLCELIADKRNEDRSLVTAWVRTKLSIALLQSCLLCIRGSRSYKHVEPKSFKETEIHIDIIEAKMAMDKL